MCFLVRTRNFTIFGAFASTNCKTRLFILPYLYVRVPICNSLMSVIVFFLIKGFWEF
jgi:hypothetical protein